MGASGSVSVAVILWASLLIFLLLLVFFIVRFFRLRMQIHEMSQQYTALSDSYHQLELKIPQIEGQVPVRVMQIFEEWKQKQLSELKVTYENMSNERAKTMFEEWRQKCEKEIREDAIKKSQSVIMGKVTEHLAPYLAQFPYNPKDARFIGTPIDLLVFNGLDAGSVSEVVFVEIKTAESKLTGRQREVRDAIDQKKVRFETFRVAEDKVEIV